MKKVNKLLIVATLIATTLSPIAEACTKITYIGANGNVLTGNNMD